MSRALPLISNSVRPLPQTYPKHRTPRTVNALALAACLPAFALGSSLAFADPIPGTLDDAPAPAGFASGTGKITNLAIGPTGSSTVLATVTQPDGKILLAGYCTAQANGNGLGIGLRNIQERLAQLYPGHSRFEIGETGGWVRAVIEIETR